MRPSVSGPTGMAIGLPVVDRLLAAHQAVGGVHGDGADLRLAQVLGDLEHDQAIVGVDVQRVQDVRQVGVEAHVDDRARDLGDRADVVGGHDGSLSFDCGRRAAWTASAPEMISMSSLVMEAWRERFICKVSFLIMSPALRVALSIAVICEPKKLAGVLQKHAEDLDGEVARQQVGQDLGLVGLELVDRAAQRGREPRSRRPRAPAAG